jgi:cytochrome c oxidase cbb3-type subunit 3
MNGRASLCMIQAALLMCACEREERTYRVQAPNANFAQSVLAMSPLQPGPKTPEQHVVNEYEQNAYAVSAGKALFSQFNCSGCHANGGGGMGPALMDAKWVYGSAPEQVYATIIEGRPNGMPSFRNRLTEQQVWQLVAFVRSLSGQLSKTVAPNRNDDMQSHKPENSIDKEGLKQSFQPPSSEMPM